MTRRQAWAVFGCQPVQWLCVGIVAVGNLLCFVFGFFFVIQEKKMANLKDPN
jgi:hypothetical protein